MQVLDSTVAKQPTFRERLIEIIDDEKVRKSLNELRERDEFIDSLVEHYIDEIGKSFESPPILKRKYEKLKDLGALIKSSNDCIDYTYILFLTSSFRNPYTQQWAEDWLVREHECCPESSLLGFLYANLRLFSSSIPGNEIIEKEAFDDLKKILMKDHQSVINAMHRLDSVMLSTFAKHKNILDWCYDNLHEKIFPKVSRQLYPKAVSSFYHATCAEYYRIAGMREEQERESRDALGLYSDNSLAKVQVAYINVKEDPKEAKELFEDALHLAKNQFSGIPTTRLSVEAMAHAGLGYLHSKRALYLKAEKCYQEALSKTSSSSESPSLQSLRFFILLNRGRSRLDDGKFQKAKEDFDEAAKEPDLLPYVETNLGILSYKQSLNGKAKSKFNHAIELKSDLAEAYYNLGVVYNEEGRKDKAIRLFKTALDIDGDLSEAHEALQKLEGSKVHDIRDWYNWWFGIETTRYKKGLGTVFLAFILLGISSAIYDVHMRNTDASSSIFGVLGFALIFLVLPLITKLKVGTIEVEMESKGERPSLYYANSLNLKSA
jgi:tetratricopeptide (TPR) repeat protein